MSIVCALCGDPVDPASHNTLQKVEGWEKKAGTRWTGTHGGSDIRGRRRLDRFAHELCVERERTGVNARQGALL